MKTTLVKIKIVVENDNKNLVMYTWKKSFLFFGKWQISCITKYHSQISDTKLESISDNAVTNVLFKNLLTNHPYPTFI